MKLRAWLILLLGMQSLDAALLPLREQWAVAVHALRTGDHSTAIHAIRDFRHWYEDEPVVREPLFREALIRQHAIAALAGGTNAEAVEQFASWFAEFPEAQQYAALMRYCYGEALAMEGLSADAAIQWQRFLDLHPQLPECALVLWKLAKAAIAEQQLDKASGHMRLLLARPDLPAGMRAIAITALAMLDLHCGDEGTAAAAAGLQQLDAIDASLADPLRALLAPALTAQLLDQNQPALASSIQSWFDWSASNLNALTALHATLGTSAATAGLRQRLWNQRAKEELAYLHNVATAADPAAEWATLYLLRLRALSATDQHHAVVILADALLESPVTATDPDFLPRIYRHAIRALQATARFEEARNRIDSFVQAHPHDPSLPALRYLNATTAAAAGELPSAIDEITSLLAAFPQHPDAFSWQVQLAQWLLQNHRPEEALATYQQLATDTPDGWHPFLALQQGICYAELGDPKAIEWFTDAATDSTASWDIREQSGYQRLKFLLSNRRIVDFHDAMRRFVAEFQHGRLLPAAQLLHSMALRSAGDNLAAWSLLREITTAADIDHHFRTHVREQYAVVSKQLQKWTHLQQDAASWLLDDLNQPHPVDAFPLRTLIDLLQQNRVSPADLLRVREQLTEATQSPRPGIPLVEALQLLSLMLDQNVVEEWIQVRYQKAVDSRHWRSLAAIATLRSERLKAQQRIAAADTIQLQALTQLPPDSRLDAASAASLAATAIRYDLPVSSKLAAMYLRRFPEHEQRPDILLLMASHAAARGDWQAAFPAVLEVVHSWPDASCWERALLAAAQWYHQRDNHTAALEILDLFFNQTSPAPRPTATALLLSAQAHIGSGQFHAAAIQLQRITSLFPAFSDIHDNATELLASIPNAIDNDPTQPTNPPL